MERGVWREWSVKRRVCGVQSVEYNVSYRVWSTVSNVRSVACRVCRVERAVKG